jgi:hypothetical protein
MDRLGPGVLKIAQRQALLIAFSQNFARRKILRRCRHPGPLPKTTGLARLVRRFEAEPLGRVNADAER